MLTVLTVLTSDHSKRAAHLSTLNNEFADTAHEHVLALVVLFIAAKKKKYEFKLGATHYIVCDVQGEKCVYRRK